MTASPDTSAHDRRRFLQRTMLAAGLLAIGPSCSWTQRLPAVPANPRSGEGLRLVASGHALGPLLPPDANGLRLPEGFSSRVLARSGQAVAGTGYVWPGEPDGGATFATADGGWVYACNSELDERAGGVSALQFDAQGRIVRAQRICGDTSRNCAGGPTPWGTWLTCEEVDRGRVLECDPSGTKPAVARDALGWFEHEAVACDPRTGHLYLTEDHPEGRLYRFRPRTPGELSAGTLEVARRVGSAAPWAIEWLPVPDPTPAAGARRTRQQVPQSSPFAGGEGAWFHAGVVYFTTKIDNRVWALDTMADRLSIVYDAATAPDPVLTGVDNIVASGNGHLFVAEDGGDMQVVVIAPDGRVQPIVQVVGHDDSEVTGVAFSPDGTRLYFSSQRGASGRSVDGGVTYEVRGPFV